MANRTLKLSDVLESKEDWTQHTMARNAKGRECDIMASEVTSFCLNGALNFAYPNEKDYKAATAKIRAHIGMEIELWNDAADRKWEDVESLIKELDL